MSDDKEAREPEKNEDEEREEAPKASSKKATGKGSKAPAKAAEARDDEDEDEDDRDDEEADDDDEPPPPKKSAKKGSKGPPPKAGKTGKKLAAKIIRKRLPNKPASYYVPFSILGMGIIAGHVFWDVKFAPVAVFGIAVVVWSFMGIGSAREAS